MPFQLADCIFGFANSDVENLLGKLEGIAGTFGQESSIAQATLTG